MPTDPITVTIEHPAERLTLARNGASPILLVRSRHTM
jgi:hypothetical protein